MLPEFILRYRNRLLADPRFHSWMQRFPLTRIVARRRSVQLFDLLAGFSYSQVLFACVELKVFTRVGLSGCSLAELSDFTGLAYDRCETLVKAAAALSLLEKRGETIMLGEQGAVLLAQPWILRFIEHHRHFYLDLTNPSDMLRGVHVAGGLRDFWSYEDAGAEKQTYSALMAESQVAVSEQILAAFDFSDHKRLLDIGGGSGAFVQAVGRRYPQLELNVFDLPGVTSLTESHSDVQVHRHKGDFRSDLLPAGMDIISVVRVIHDHDDAAIMALLRNIRSSVDKGTTLLIAEPFSGNRATARVTDAYFNLYFAAMGQGRTRTPKEIASMATQAGFGDLRIVPSRMPLITGILTLRAT